MVNGDERTVKVEILLLHNDTEYKIIRNQIYICNNDNIKGLMPQVAVYYKKSDGQSKQIAALEVKNIINKILPEDLASYFFFDTERMKNISTKSDVAKAVKDILGLSSMSNAIDHLGDQSQKTSVIGKFYSEIDSVGNAKAEDAKNRIKQAEDKQKAIAKQLETCNSEIKLYEDRKEQLSNFLRQNQSTANLQKEKEKYERLIKIENKNMEESIEKYFKEFSYGSLSFFAQPLIKKALDFIKEVKIDDKGVKDLTKTTIMELLNRGKCICGCELHEGNEAYKHLMNELSYVPPESIGNTVRHYREKLESFSKPADRIYERLTDLFKNINDSRIRIYSWDDNLRDISERIKGRENMRKYEEELEEVKKRLYNQNVKKERLLGEEGFQKSEIERYRKIYDKLVITSSKNKQIMIWINYAEKIKKWLLENYKIKEETIRSDLENEVNKIFERMYHGNRRVSIDSKYRVTLLTSISDDKEIISGESEGLNRVKNFAFIAGLVSIAKKKITLKDQNADFNLASEPYPLVMDAPFSNADEKHIANISKELPEVAEQVIMFVMKKDWNYAEPVMSYRVGKQYQLKKETETFTRFLC